MQGAQQRAEECPIGPPPSINAVRRSSRRALASLINEPRKAAIKNNIEPDEHCEEADTIPPRGVNPETRLAPGSRPTLYTSVGLVATLLGLGYVLIHVQGLTPLPMLFRPTRGLVKYEM